MASYTRVNLIDDVPDMAPRFGVEGLESRFAKGQLETEKSGLSMFRLQPGARLPFGHRHAEQEELYVVVEGSLRFRIEDEEVELRQWDALRVSPDAWRGMIGGPDGGLVIAFGAPTSADAPQDAEASNDWW